MLRFTVFFITSRKKSVIYVMVQFCSMGGSDKILSSPLYFLLRHNMVPINETVPVTVVIRFRQRRGML